VKNEASYIEFRPAYLSPGMKTDKWAVVTTGGLHILGEVRWFNAWRGYALIAEAGTVFEEKCLREIAEFTEEQTNLHRAKQQEIRRKK
jgi:hypothetical protein